MEDVWIKILAYVFVGFLLLVKGGDWLVRAGAEWAKRIGVPLLIVGLTVVAWGTSAPELMVSGLAAVQGNNSLSLGNVLGSNVANIGLVLGASAFVLPGVLEQRMKIREIFWLFAAVGVLAYLSQDGELTRQDGWVLLGAFAIHNLHLLLTARSGEVQSEEAKDLGSKHPGRHLILGALGLAAGAWLVVEGAKLGGRELGISEQVIGLTVLAVGTSLPELAAGLAGAFKGVADISMGNVVGSNVFNLLMALGVVVVIHPLVGSDAQVAVDSAFTRDIPAVAGFSLAAVLLPYLGGARGGSLKGLALLVTYGTYIKMLFS